MSRLLSASSIWAPSIPAPATIAGPALTIDLNAIATNTRFFAAQTSGVLIAVIKADGYGHGALDVARTALTNGATQLGVASIHEGVALRNAGMTAPIVSWLNHPDEADFQRAVDVDIDIAVPTVEHLAAVARTHGQASVHLHLDTGMARDGAAPTTWIELCRLAREAEIAGQIRVVGLMGHLAEAEDPGAPSNSTGRAVFEWGVDVARLSGLRPNILHLAATCATLTLAGTHFGASRVGAGLVGIDLSRTAHLAQPLTLRAPLVSVREVSAGTSVGYGRDWIAPRDTRLGLVALGYADGLPRSASGSAEVQVRGRRLPVVGRMSMDQFVVDLGNGEEHPGETVTVFGSGDAGEPTAADWANWSGTIQHEIVTHIGARVRRVVVGANDARGAA